MRRPIRVGITTQRKGMMLRGGMRGGMMRRHYSQPLKDKEVQEMYVGRYFFLYLVLIVAAIPLVAMALGYAFYFMTIGF